MSRLPTGIRWWLALSFALVSGLTALAVAVVSSERSEQAFRSRTDVLALGNTVAATLRLRESLTDIGQENALQGVAAGREGEVAGLRTAFDVPQLAPLMRDIASDNELSVFVFNEEAQLISSDISRGVDVSFVPDFPDAVAAGLEGRRWVETLTDEAATVVALPLLVPLAGSGVVLTYVPQAEFASTVGIFRREIVFAALVAIPVGALAGLAIAAAIAARLRRLADATAAIEAGDFETELKPRFPDELGELGQSIDRMRVQLRESFALIASDRDRLGQLLERLRDGVVTVDRDLNVEFANGAAKLALRAAQLEDGESLPDPWPELDLTALAAGLFRDHAQVAQARVTPPDGETYEIVGIPAGEVGESAVLVVRDVSEQERRERAEREFVTNAAHELRTPLAAISSSVEVLQGGAKEIPEDRDRFLGHIEREAGRLTRLARALLVLARAQTNQEQPRFQPTLLRPILEDVSAGLQVSDGVQVEVICSPDIAALSDPDLVEQTVVNLAANAAKHTHEGSIVLAAREGHGRRVVIAISDTGSGIPSSEQARVFDRFFRGDDRGEGDGFGLGLAIVRQSVRALGGKVSVRSRDNTGTTVEVMLPAAGDRSDDPSQGRAVDGDRTA
jgi:signal transduction histidine kinase